MAAMAAATGRSRAFALVHGHQMGRPINELSFISRQPDGRTDSGQGCCPAGVGAPRALVRDVSAPGQARPAAGRTGELKVIVVCEAKCSAAGVTRLESG